MVIALYVIATTRMKKAGISKTTVFVYMVPDIQTVTTCYYCMNIKLHVISIN